MISEVHLWGGMSGGAAADAEEGGQRRQSRAGGGRDDISRLSRWILLLLLQTLLRCARKLFLQVWQQPLWAARNPEGLDTRRYQEEVSQTCTQVWHDLSGTECCRDTLTAGITLTKILTMQRQRRCSRRSTVPMLSWGLSRPMTTKWNLCGLLTKTNWHMFSVMRRKDNCTMNMAALVFILPTRWVGDC